MGLDNKVILYKDTHSLAFHGGHLSKSQREIAIYRVGGKVLSFPIWWKEKNKFGTVHLER